MSISLDPNKSLEILSKIKIHNITLIIAFISSFNLWFLSIYFFQNDFFYNHEILIIILSTLALTTIWTILHGMSILRSILSSVKKISNVDITNLDINEVLPIVNTFILIRVVLSHSVFIIITYLFNLTFFTLLILSFGFSALYYLITHISAIITFKDYLK